MSLAATLAIVAGGVVLRVLLEPWRRARAQKLVAAAEQRRDAENEVIASEGRDATDLLCRTEPAAMVHLLGTGRGELSIDRVAVVRPAPAATDARTGGYRDGPAPGDAESTTILQICPGRHVFELAQDGKTFRLDVLLHPQEEHGRRFDGIAWTYLTPAELTRARARYDDDLASEIDYAEDVLPRTRRVAKAGDRVAAALEHHAKATQLLVTGAEPDNTAVRLELGHIVSLLDGAGLTQDRLDGLVARMSLGIVAHQQKGDTFLPLAATLAHFALTVLPDEPRLLLLLAEIEAERGRGAEARRHAKRALERRAYLDADSVERAGQLAG